MTRDTMTAADALWRIAELASRSSDPRWRGDHGQAMADLEAAISEVGARLSDCAAGRHQGPATGDEAGARVGPARGETDRERALASRWKAEAAEARAQAMEAGEALARCQAALQTAERDRDDDRRTLRRAHQELSTTQAALGRAEVERDKARSALGSARSDLAAARAAQEESETNRLAAQRGRLAAEMERDAAISLLDSAPRLDSTPRDGIELRRPEAAPVEPESRGDQDVETVVDLRMSPAREAVRPRLLHVAATLGHLLPEDLDGLLRPGVQVVRREGRLAALLAMPVSAAVWAENSIHFDEEQAEALRAAGLRVAWSAGGCLAS